jgi:hypothetical protein
VAAVKIPLEKAALLTGTRQNLSNSFSLDIYDIYYTLNTLEVFDIMLNQGILKGEVCTIDLLFDLFGLTCFANKNKNCQLSCS